MHADGKSTLASVSKWNSGKVNCAGTAFVQGDSVGGSKLTEQTLHISYIMMLASPLEDA